MKKLNNHFGHWKVTSMCFSKCEIHILNMRGLSGRKYYWQDLSSLKQSLVNHRL